MKFELKPAWQRVTDDELLEDLRRVAQVVGKSTITKSSYDKYGQHYRGTVARRFGSWPAALKRAGLTPQLPTTREDLIGDLRRVAHELGRNYISFVEYRKLGRWSERPYVRVFGNWRAALEAAGLERHPNLKDRISDDQLLENIETVWTALGRQPSYSDIHKPLSAFSASTYLNRFGTWRQALEAFIAWINQAVSQAEEPEQTPSPSFGTTAVEPEQILFVRRRTPRAVNLRLRFRVMQRDNFTCRFCGRSPALKPGVVLHVDHVRPWEKGGETEISNLQTLCDQCNLGKSNLL